MLSRHVLRTIPQAIRAIRRLSTARLEGITLQHLRVMVLVSEGMGPSQIAETLQISLPAVSKTVNTLSSKGLLKRSPGEDKRSLILKLTGKGRKTLDSLSRAVEKELEKALDKLSTPERRSLEKGLMVMDKLVIHLKED